MKKKITTSKKKNVKTKPSQTVEKELSTYEKYQIERQKIWDIVRKKSNNEVVNENGVVVVKPIENTENQANTKKLKQTVSVKNGVVLVNAPVEDNGVEKEKAKKVITYDLNKKENGFLIELFKDGRFTTTYLSAASPGAFKGYHLHKVREANYICVRGKIKVILYTASGREEHVLSATKPERLHIPAGIPTGLSNEWKEEAWIVNNPSPPFDPELKDEQIDYTEEQCERKEYLK